MAETKYQRLIRLLKDMFQLGDAAELDFGIYRIMHARKAEIEKFLDKELFQKHVKDALAKEAGGQRQQLQAEIDELVQKLKDVGIDDPSTNDKYNELTAQRDAEPDQSALEDEVYANLLTFFGRYYSEGDFISQRRYGDDTYAIPYNGEEVKLYWANHDQYYIKSSEDLKHYAFFVGPESNRKRVRFKLVAATTERDNIKEKAGQERWHIVSDKEPITEEAGDLVIPFEYRVVDRQELVDRLADLKAAESAKPQTGKLFKEHTKDSRADDDSAIDEADAEVGRSSKNRRDELASVGAKAVLASKAVSAEWKRVLEAGYENAQGQATGRSVIEHHIRRYVARATFDYFIHKDLGGFLRQELDWYVKHELVQLKDILDDNQTLDQLGRRHFAKLRVLHTVAGKVIDFLAQLENFQKKLWLKKKFVLETQYLVRVGMIPDEFYAEIAGNSAQHEEWVQLYAIDEHNAGGYSRTLKPAFLKAHPTLVVDTSHFDQSFRSRLLEALGDIDEQTDGVLIHSENFQALRTVHCRFNSLVGCVYLDPPYNTGDSEILYKNSYLHSSWLSLMENRLAEAVRLMTDDAVLFLAIDDFEMTNLAKLVDAGFPQLRREMIIVNHHPQGGKATAMSHTHEYMLACIPVTSDRTLVGRSSHDGVEQRSFKRGGTAESNFRRGRPNSFYAILVDPATKTVRGLEAPPVTPDYPTGNTEEGLVRVYPLGKRGEERVWRRSYESCMALLEMERLICSDNYSVYQLIEMDERTAALFSNWVDPRYNAGTQGANLLANILGQSNAFAYPKSIHTVGDALFAVDLSDNDIVLDFFGGSGTTGHATILLNREDGCKRKFSLVEMGHHFDTVMLPRLKKVTFAPDWRDGKPQRLATREESHRSPRLMKVVRLESYEDACDNIFLERSKQQQKAFDSLPEPEREKYRLHYMLDVESRGSESLLNIEEFARPFEYTLRVTRDDKEAPQTIDLVETFNWLLGLKVETIRLSKDKSFKDEHHGIVEVTGEDPDGNRCLVVWRNTDEVDDAMLIEWFKKNRYKVKDFEWHLIYVNGDNTLENLKRDDESWTVRMIEQEFHRLMFEGTE